MRRLLAAALLALVMAGYASADYLLIVVNLNAKPPSDTDDGLGGGTPMPMPMPMPPPMGKGGQMPGGPQYAEEADDQPDLIVAVVEVKSISKDHAKQFGDGKREVKFKHNWGEIELVNNTFLYEAVLLKKSSGDPLPTVKERFAAKKKAILEGSEKPTTQKAIKEVALLALELGLVDECANVLDKLAESDKNNASVKAYLAVKADLAKPLDNFDLATKWKEKLLNGYKVSHLDKHHFALIHSTDLKDDEVKPHLEQLEKSFRAYYYWWACKGVALPVATDPQVAVLTEVPKEFSALQTNLTASPILADSFFARREGLSVFSRRRGDQHYSKLEQTSKEMWDLGFERHLILKGKTGKGSGIPQKDREDRPIHPKLQEMIAKKPRLYALMLKSMEHEWEQTSLTHQASRQMLFASKQLPRNVQSPEWIQFGMGSFFETPLQSPWPSIGGANPYWMPRFRESYKKYEAKPEALLEKVVTDAYFREKPKGEKEAAVKSREANLRKARASAWALTFYLARSVESDDNPKYLAMLQRYFKELSKQPRDVMLDEKTLWACFTKAFELTSPSKIRAFAGDWIRYVLDEPLDAKAIHEKISEFHKKMTTPPPDKKKDGGSTSPMPKMP